jgi:hypothetical protein
MNSLENELKVDIINQRQGENLANINFMQTQIEATSEQELIDQYNNEISDLVAKNLALESLKQTIL